MQGSGCKISIATKSDLIIQQILNFDGRLIPVLSLKHLFKEMEDGDIVMRLKGEEDTLK